MDFDELVREALRLSGLNQSELAGKLGVSQGTVSRWLSTKSTPEIEHWMKVKAFVGRYSSQPMFAEDGPTIPLSGFVGAGAEIFPFDGDDHPLEYVVPAIPIPHGTNAAVVRGDSMYPRYFDGEIIYYRSEQQDPTSVIGRECVVKLANGRMLVKILRRGTAKGLFRLESWNAPPIEDVVVEYAIPVFFAERK